MPKLINHEVRRADLVDAAGELIAEGGPYAATVRAVANRARVAAGSVRFIFPTQEELLSAVAADIVARTMADVDLRTRHYRKPDMAPSRLAAALPITGEAKAVWRVERELRFGRSELSPVLARCRQARAAECSLVLQALTIGFTVPADFMEFEGRRTLALLEGLGEQLLDATPPISNDQARYILRTHLERIRTSHRPLPTEAALDGQHGDRIALEL